jgi:L-iditol 2-dehydrogenase
MRIAVVTGPGHVELRQAPAPSPGPRQILVEVGGCGLCTLDRRLFSGEQELYPAVAGHEPAGRIVEIGSELAQLPGAPQLGTTVAVDMRTRCGVCNACRRGRSAICLAPQGHRGPDGAILIAGGLADLIVADYSQVWPVGEVSMELAAMAEPVACVVHSLRRGGLRGGDRVAVIGGGYMGRLHLTLARVAGASSVGVIELSPERRTEALAAGANWATSPDEARHADGECDVVFVTAGGPGVLELAVDLLAKGGSVVLYGAFPDELEVGVHPNHMHHAESSIIGMHSHEPEDWRTAAGLIANGVIASDLEALVTARFALNDVVGAFELAANSPVYRVIVNGG